MGQEAARQEQIEAAARALHKRDTDTHVAADAWEWYCESARLALEAAAGVVPLPPEQNADDGVDRVALQQTVQAIIDELAPREKLAGGCGTPYCDGWMAEVKWADDALVVTYDCPCGSESGWDSFGDFLKDCREIRENAVAAPVSLPAPPNRIEEELIADAWQLVDWWLNARDQHIENHDSMAREWIERCNAWVDSEQPAPATQESG